MKHIYISIFFITIVLFFIQGCTSIFLQKHEVDFIKVNNGKFILDGKPYYFVGTNMWYGCYLGSRGITGNRGRLKRELDLLERSDITNLRILAASEDSEIKNSVKPAIQTKPGIYDNDLLDGLDYLLYEMSKRNMHAVVFLNNYWEWSGGMSQYNAWFNGGHLVDPAINNAWHDFMNFSATFYNNEKANQCFRDFVKFIINRKNNYSGIEYRNDPTIMAWQLANEPRPAFEGDSIANQNNFYRWIEETAKYIHSLDTNHLVTTGNEGLAGSLQSEQIYLTAHSSKYIDYITFHLWPKNWGWYNAKRINETYPSTQGKAVNYINRHIRYARMLNKPITLEEFGLSRDSEFVKSSTSVSIRDKYFTTVFQLVYDSAAAGAPFAGTNFWTWGGEGRAQHEDARWQKGDPFTGDPPQEPQGFNSVFDTDTSTLNVISTFGRKMKELGDNEEKIISLKDKE